MVEEGLSSAEVRRRFPVERLGPFVGDRVRLVHCDDPHTRLEPGELGTVSSVDDLGTVHVAWDSGTRLGLVAEAGDRFEVIERPAP
jgi:hypothetical protein